jgi:hypothetical protein
MIAKLGEFRGKFFRNESRNFHVQFFVGYVPDRIGCWWGILGYVSREFAEVMWFDLGRVEGLHAEPQSGGG